MVGPWGSENDEEKGRVWVCGKKRKRIYDSFTITLLNKYMQQPYVDKTEFIQLQKR